MIAIQKPNKMLSHGEKSYDPKLLSFVHDGWEIRIPLLSECGRMIVDPVKTYGFSESEIGGGGTVLVKEIPGEGWIVLTDKSGEHIPDKKAWESAIIWRFNAKGEQLAWFTAGNIPIAE